uniref:Glycosyl-4,4'-diaponeurosporenoate acyltransferase n=1 Tax=Nannocystis pusilla TaxID=889268 RepID=A0A291FH09_9BACT|nr:hypothetical protein [Nannocystis pusilla]
MSELSVYTPLPPQPWGWLPTEQFWARAFLTPIALLFWLPLFLLLFPLTLYFPVAWWQSALASYLYYQIWGGLVERLARQWLAQRHRRRPVADSGIASSSPERVPAPCSRWNMGGLDNYEDFMSRSFGRYDRLVHHVVNLAFFFFIFYPGWWTKALGVLWIAALTGFVRAFARRRRMGGPVEPALPPALDRSGP